MRGEYACLDDRERERGRERGVKGEGKIRKSRRTCECEVATPLQPQQLLSTVKMVPSCQPGSISRGEPASPSSLTCGCTLGAKKKLTISLNLSSKDCDVPAFFFEPSAIPF